MSDGPHKSLEMKLHWKALAERADKTAFGPDDVSEKFCEAVERDVKNEVPKAALETIRDLLQASEQQQLFPDQAANELAQLKGNCPGTKKR